MGQEDDSADDRPQKSMRVRESKLRRHGVEDTHRKAMTSQHDKSAVAASVRKSKKVKRRNHSSDTPPEKQNAISEVVIQGRLKKRRKRKSSDLSHSKIKTGSASASVKAPAVRRK